MEDLKEWLSDVNHDYKVGVELFGKYSRNRHFYRNFQRWGANRLPQLEYELGKLYLQQTPQVQLQKNIVAEPTKIKLPSNKNNADIPAIIQETKNILVDLQTKISMLHNQLYELGESNSDDIVKKRKKLLDEKAPLVTLYEQLYELKEEYFVTKILNPKLEALLHNNSDFVVDKEIKDYSNLSDMELERSKHRLTSRISKLENRLKYQSVTKQDKENPMPEGVKRKEVEAKLKQLKNDQKTVYKLIQKRCS